MMIDDDDGDEDDRRRKGGTGRGFVLKRMCFVSETAVFECKTMVCF